MSKISIEISFEGNMTDEQKNMIENYFGNQMNLAEKMADQFRPFEEHFGKIKSSKIVVE